MIRFAGFFILAVLFMFGPITTVTSAADPSPSEQKEKEKKDMGGPKLQDDKKKEEKKDMGGK